jgi:membrane glycosyltransferase
LESDELSKLQQESGNEKKKKKLIQEFCTRWSSTYEMICDLHCDSQQSEINQQIQTMFEQGVILNLALAQ